MPEFELPSVAVIADAHFHDINSDYGCTGITIDGKRLMVRSWDDTRNSSRVFNESGAALRAALDELCNRGVRHVVLLGDYTDDGQVESTRSTATLLQHYRNLYGLAFYALPGNHDVFGPLGKHQSTRFVTDTDQTTLVTSNPKIAATEPEDAVLTRDMYCEGMPEGFMAMAGFGYFRRSEYLHWETPFGSSDAAKDRMFDANSADGTVTRRLMDASYLVEPEPGLWLLMIDANVFEPRSGDWRIEQKKAFIDSTDAGWNGVLRVKPFLIDWISDVSKRADQLGKTLLTFSHYPVIDPFDDQNDNESKLFGNTEVIRRRPETTVATALIKAGVFIHFSGHYHVNTVTQRTENNRLLTNIAVPSLVAFPAGFKILQPGKNQCRIDTVSVFDIPCDQRLLSIYANELRQRREPVDEIVDVANYGEFLYHHTRARAQHHYLPHKWPTEASEIARSASVADIACLLLQNSEDIRSAKLIKPQLFYNAEVNNRLQALAAARDVTLAELQECKMLDLVTDWYCLRQAGPMIYGFIPPNRMKLYRFLAYNLLQKTNDGEIVAPDFWVYFLDALRQSLSFAEDSGKQILVQRSGNSST